MKSQCHTVTDWDVSLWFARPGSLAGDAAVSLHLREFVKNSRIFAVFAVGANRGPQFSFPRNQLVGPRLARDELIPPSTKETNL